MLKVGILIKQQPQSQVKVNLLMDGMKIRGNSHLRRIEKKKEHL